MRKIALVVMLGVLSPIAFATGSGGDGCLLSDCSTTNEGGRGGRGGDGGNAHQGQGQAQGQGQLQGQLQGQDQGQGQGQAQIGINSSENDNRNYNTGINSNHNSSESASRSGAVSGAAAYNGGNRVSNVVGGHEVGASAVTGDSTATVGPTTATTGAVTATTAPSTASSDSGDHNSEVNVNDNSSYTEDNDYPVAQAATVFAGYCQNGMSGQLEEGGFSVISGDQFCTYIRLADAMYQAYEREMSKCKPVCDAVCTEELASVELKCPVEASDRGEEFLDNYYAALSEAQKLVMRTKHTATLDRFSGHLIRPLASILAFIWVL